MQYVALKYRHYPFVVYVKKFCIRGIVWQNNYKQSQMYNELVKDSNDPKHIQVIMSPNLIVMYYTNVETSILNGI